MIRWAIWPSVRTVGGRVRPSEPIKPSRVRPTVPRVHAAAPRTPRRRCLPGRSGLTGARGPSIRDSTPSGRSRTLDTGCPCATSGPPAGHRSDSFDAVLNYGVNRVRFPAPVPVGAKVRGVISLVSAQERIGGTVEATWGIRYEVEGGDRPPCVAETVYLYRLTRRFGVSHQSGSIRLARAAIGRHPPAPPRARSGAACRDPTLSECAPWPVSDAFPGGGCRPPRLGRRRTRRRGGREQTWSDVPHRRWQRTRKPGAPRSRRLGCARVPALARRCRPRAGAVHPGRVRGGAWRPLVLR